MERIVEKSKLCPNSILHPSCIQHLFYTYIRIYIIYCFYIFISTQTLLVTGNDATEQRQSHYDFRKTFTLLPTKETATCFSNSSVPYFSFTAAFSPPSIIINLSIFHFHLLRICMYVDFGPSYTLSRCNGK